MLLSLSKLLSCIGLFSSATIYICIYRTNHRSCSVKKVVLTNFAKFTGKNLRESLFFNKVAGLRPANLLKKRLWHRCFAVSFEKFVRTPSLQKTSGQLLLYLGKRFHDINYPINLL